MIRYAIVTTTSDRDNVAAYMPGNYEVIYSEPSRESFAREGWRSVVIAGEDNAGWTLDGYVLPRLASGMMTGKEIDLSHDIMSRVPDTLEFDPPETCERCASPLDKDGYCTDATCPYSDHPQTADWPDQAPVLTVEVTLPDGTVARWALNETDDRTVDRLTCAIENVIGKADTIIC